MQTTSSEIATAQQRQAVIDQQVQAFLAKGGKVEKLPVSFDNVAPKLGRQYVVSVERMTSGKALEGAEKAMKDRKRRIANAIKKGAPITKKHYSTGDLASRYCMSIPAITALHAVHCILPAPVQVESHKKWAHDVLEEFEAKLLAEVADYE